MASESRFAEVRKLLERRGWSLARISGSHHIFVKQGELPISVPVHRGKVKSVYVKKIQQNPEEDGKRPSKGD